MKYANFTDDHVPAPSTHTERTHDYQADGRWLACGVNDTAEVRR